MRSHLRGSAAFFIAAIILSGASAGSESDSTLVPLNGKVFRLRQPDGIARLFVRDSEDPRVLQGEYPWVGEVDGRTALIRTDENFAGDAQGFFFQDGRLRRMLRGTVDTAVPLTPYVLSEAARARLWPEAPAPAVDPNPPDIWAGSGRLRLWFENPNCAGIFLVGFVLFFAGLGLSIRKHCAVLSCAAFLISAVGTIAVFLTGSRGSFLSLLVGLGCWGLVALRKRIGLKFIVTAGLIGAFLFAGVRVLVPGDRFSSGLVRVDDSNRIRVEMLEQAPRMFAAAPWGWGLGKSGRAYVDWFQSKSTLLCVDLVSSHLTALVELGWWKGGLYVFVWSFALLVLFVRTLRDSNAAVLSLWAALFVSGFVNPTLGRGESFAFPLLATVVAVFWRRPHLRWSHAVCALIAVGMAGVACGSLVAWGKRDSTGPSIWKTGGVVAFHDSKPETFIVDDGFTMNGGYWWFEGREIRRWLRRHPKAVVGFVREVEDLPATARRIVFVGRSGESALQLWQQNALPLERGCEVVFLSPSFPLSRISDDFRGRYQTRVFSGEFALDSEAVRSPRPTWLTIVRGAELYLPKWLDYAVL